MYGQSDGQELAKREKDDDAAGAPRQKKKLVVTAADKKANTPAYQNYKKGDKRYAAADHLKDEVEVEGGDLQEKEVDVKDTRRTVDAIRAYDRAKDASRDATYDTDKGNKKKGDKEKAYAAKERGEIKKDDPNWKNRKYHTGIHGESATVQDLTNVYIEGVLKKEVKALKKGAETLKGKDVAKADEIADEFMPSETVSKLAESGHFSVEELWKIVEVEEGYQRNPEEGERKERESAKKREAIPGQARRGMPPRGDKKREEFEKWYAANVR